MHIDFLRHLRDAVKRECPERWKTNSWFLLHDNAPAHRSVSVMNFLAHNNVTKLELPPPLRLIPADFYLFPRLKSALKGRRFCDVHYIINKATEELKRLSQNDLQESFQHLCSCWQKYIVANGDYFAGNVA
jgi:hypothetical protein